MGLFPRLRQRERKLCFYTMEGEACSFQEIVGGKCGFSSKDKENFVKLIRLLNCTSNIDKHKSALALTDVQNEVELILARSRFFSRPQNIDQLKICPHYRETPTLRFVYYRQDNAGCYRSSNTILGAVKAGEAREITVRRLDFSDPQGGKGSCDRKAATIKAHIKVHLNEGHDVETASQMVDAMQSWVRLCDRVVSSPVLQIKLDGVSTIENVKYSDTFIRVWKTYGMGPGKKITFSKVKLPPDLQTASLSTRCSAEIISAQFCTVKSRRTASNPSASEGGVQSIPSTTGSGLYPCPEEGCTKFYQRLSSLQNHLDCGKHVRSLEKETILDKAVRGYAARLEGQFVGVPQFGDRARADQEAQSTTQKTTVSMSWALKSSQGGKTRFSDKQRDYLTSKF